MKKTFLVAIGLALAVPAFAHDNHGGKPKPVACGELTGLRLEDTTITLGQLLPAGANPNPVGACGDGSGGMNASTTAAAMASAAPIHNRLASTVASSARTENRAA